MSCNDLPSQMSDVEVQFILLLYAVTEFDESNHTAPARCEN